MIETIDAIQVTGSTMVGIMGSKFPLPRGNCFSVETVEGERFRIANFGLENWEEMIRRGIGFPIKIMKIDERRAIVHDERIPDNWYDNNWCEICCPRSLLPKQQLHAHDRAIKNGSREEREHSTVHHFAKVPRL